MPELIPRVGRSQRGPFSGDFILTLLVIFTAILAVASLGGMFWLSLLIRRQNSTRELTPLLMDLQERISRTISDLREATSEKLQKTQLEASERLERTLAHNRTELAQGLTTTTETLNLRFKGLETQVSERLTKIGENVEEKLNANLKEGFQHFEKVQQHLASAELKLQELNQVGRSIQDLNSLLKLPHLRGSFGESTLEKLLADFLPVGSYETQYAIVPNSPERVDAIVRLARQILPIDSKFPREQVLPLFESENPADLELARKALSDFVKSEAKDIAKKYIRPDHGTTDMALLFLPSETLYFEVIRNVGLFAELSKLKVYPVSPNTLAMGLHSVSVAQEYYEMARGVEKTIEDVKKARRNFEHFEKRFDDVGKGLKKAQEAFETANTHLTRFESSVYRLVGESPDTSGNALPDAGGISKAESKSEPTTGSLF
jgi:DNA recombination protein RmuC